VHFPSCWYAQECVQFISISKDPFQKSLQLICPKITKKIFDFFVDLSTILEEVGFSMQKNTRTKMLVMMAMFIALDVVLTRMLSITTPVIRIGFGFVPIALCAMLYGPIWAGVVGALADIVGIMLFPIATFFPAFTLSAVIIGVVFGLFLHKPKGHWLPILIAVVINCFGVSLILNTVWLTIITNNSFFALLPLRTLQSFIMLAIQFTTLFAIEKTVGARLRSQFGVHQE
jgi:ECF transporter S component (folate family)